MPERGNRSGKAHAKRIRVLQALEVWLECQVLAGRAGEVGTGQMQAS